MTRFAWDEVPAWEQPMSFVFTPPRQRPEPPPPLPPLPPLPPKPLLPEADAVQAQLAPAPCDVAAPVVPADAVLLGTDVATNQPLYLPQAARNRGLYVLGVPGSGKSTFLLNLICQDMQQGKGLCLIEPHSDLINAVLVRVPPERLQDVLYVNAGDSQIPFGVNLFACPDLQDPAAIQTTLDMVLQTFKKLFDASWGFQLEEVLSNIILTLMFNPGSTMADIPRLLTDLPFRQQLVARITTARYPYAPVALLQSFWQDFVDGGKSQQSQLIRPTRNKVHQFLRSPMTARMVSSPETTIDFAAVMEQGKILLVLLPKEDLGGDDVVKLIGAVLLGQLLQAVQHRAKLARDARTQFNLYCDEFHLFVTDFFATLFKETRKYNLAPTVAHQQRIDLDEKNSRATLGAGTLAIFSVVHADARELSASFTQDTVQDAGSSTLRPIQALLAAGHRDDEAQDLTRTWLRPLVQAAAGQDTLRYVARTLKDALVQLDAYLLDAMRKDITLYSPEEQDHLATLASSLRGYVGFAPAVGHVQEPNADGTQDQDVFYEVSLSAAQRAALLPFFASSAARQQGRIWHDVGRDFVLAYLLAYPEQLATYEHEPAGFTAYFHAIERQVYLADVELVMPVDGRIHAPSLQELDAYATAAQERWDILTWDQKLVRAHELIQEAAVLSRKRQDQLPQELQKETIWTLFRACFPQPKDQLRYSLSSMMYYQHWAEQLDARIGYTSPQVRLAHLLAAYPVPRYQRHGSNATAQRPDTLPPAQLVQVPQFHFHCRFADDVAVREYLVRGNPEPPVAADAAQRRERIISRSRVVGAPSPKAASRPAPVATDTLVLPEPDPGAGPRSFLRRRKLADDELPAAR